MQLEWLQLATTEELLISSGGNCDNLWVQNGGNHKTKHVVMGTIEDYKSWGEDLKNGWIPNGVKQRELQNLKGGSPRKIQIVSDARHRKLQVWNGANHRKNITFAWWQSYRTLWFLSSGSKNNMQILNWWIHGNYAYSKVCATENVTMLSGGNHRKCRFWMVGTTTMYGVRVLGVIKNINIKLRSSHKTYNWSGRKLKNSDFE